LQQPAPDGVEVQFVAKEGGAYSVSLETSSDTSGSCSTPCTLHVTPGPATLKVRGLRDYEQHVTIPSGGTRVTLESACVGCYVWAAVLLGLGVPGDIAAIAYAEAVPDCSAYRGSDLDLCKSDHSRLTAYAIGFGVVGFTLTGIGLIKLISGASQGSSKAVMRAVGDQDGSASGRPRFVGFGVSAASRAQSASLTFSF